MSTLPNRLRDQSGFTLLEILVAMLILAVIMTIAYAAYGVQQDRSHDTATQQSLTTALKSTKSIYIDGKRTYPSEGQLLTELAHGEPALDFVAYSNGDYPSSGPTNISVSRDSDEQVTLCARSKSTRVYCARVNEQANLELAKAGNDEEGLFGDIVALIPGAPYLFPTDALADSWEESNASVSKCVGTSEALTRNCLATVVVPPTPNTGAEEGWDGDPEPAPTYDEVVEGDDPSATCGFDEQGTQLECDGIDGEYGEEAPVVETGQDGAITENPGDNTAVDLNGDEHDSVGTPSGDVISNEGDNWSIEAWVKPKSAGTSNGIVSSDDHWVLRFAKENGFTCGTNTTGQLYTVTGGPAATKNKWYHVVCTYETGTLKLYVNGDVVGTVTGVPNGKAGSGPWRPGYVGDGWTNGGSLHGVLDAFAFYQRTLSAAEVGEHYIAAGHS